MDLGHIAAALKIAQIRSNMDSKYKIESINLSSKDAARVMFKNVKHASFFEKKIKNSEPGLSHVISFGNCEWNISWKT